MIGPLNSEITSKKHASEENVEVKRHLFTEQELKQEGRALPVHPPRDCVGLGFFAAPRMSVNDHKIHATYCLGGLQTHLSGLGDLKNIESMNNED